MDKFNAGGERIEVDATYPDQIDVADLIGKIEIAFMKKEKRGKK